MPWFRKKKGKIEPVSDKDRVVRTENVFVRCEECGEHLYKKELEEALKNKPSRVEETKIRTMLSSI